MGFEGRRRQQRSDRAPAPGRRPARPHVEGPGGPRDVVLGLQSGAGNRATASYVAAGRSAGTVQRDDPPAAPVVLDELEREYDDAKEKERSLYDHRQIGAREALANLLEQDEPSIADIILKAAVMGALGFVSGGLSTAVTGRILAEGASQAVENAVQSGIDDAFKDAIPALVERALARGTTSRSSYFAGIEAGVVKLREAAVLTLNEQELAAKGAARRDPATLAPALAAVRARKRAVDGLKETAQQLQYRESLSQWLVAVAQARLGADATYGGTNVRNVPGWGGDPTRFFHQRATGGVLRISFGLRRASRPVGINHAVLTGLNDATKAQLRNVKLRDFHVPIFAQGWLYASGWDALEKGDNEVSMGRNEQGVVYVNYGEDAEEAMKAPGFARGRTEVLDIARDVIDQDFGERTIGSLDLVT